VIAADQLSKAWVRSYPEGYSIYQLGFLELRRIQNTGAAFGLFQGQGLALSIIALAGIVVILFLVLSYHRRFPLLAALPTRIALGLILGGAVGNLIDRLSLGYVTDFIDFHLWPAFNVADSSTTVGAIIIAYCLIRLATAPKA